jgi:hypothetical protein
MGAQKKYQQLYIGLIAEDRERVAQLAKAKNVTATELAREAIRWYLEHHEEAKEQPKENASALAIKYGTDQLVKSMNSGVDRICKMLARQGRAIGTLYELSWMSLPDDENARKAFEEAANRAKKRMARHVENDEKEVAESMKKVVNS